MKTERKGPEAGDRWINTTTLEHFDILAIPQFLFTHEKWVVMAATAVPVDRPLICRGADNRDTFYMVSGGVLMDINDALRGIDIAHIWESRQGDRVWALPLNHFMARVSEGGIFRFFLVGDKCEIERCATFDNSHTVCHN